jgi:hypothetical protein
MSQCQGDGFTEPFALVTLRQQPDGTERLIIERGYDTAAAMYRDVIRSYAKPPQNDAKNVESASAGAAGLERPQQERQRNFGGSGL